MITEYVPALRRNLYQREHFDMWSRIKKYGLSLSEDVDGDTEEETCVHRALVDYYVHTYHLIPEFLGGNGQPIPETHSKPLWRSNTPSSFASAMGSRPSTSSSGLNSDYGNPSANSGSLHPNMSVDGSTSLYSSPSMTTPSPRTTPKPSLQDIYQRSNQQQQLQPQFSGNSISSQTSFHSNGSGLQRSSNTYDDSIRRPSTESSRVHERLTRRRNPSPPGAANGAGQQGGYGYQPARTVTPNNGSTLTSNSNSAYNGLGPNSSMYNSSQTTLVPNDRRPGQEQKIYESHSQSYMRQQHPAQPSARPAQYPPQQASQQYAPQHPSQYNYESSSFSTRDPGYGYTNETSASTSLSNDYYTSSASQRQGGTPQEFTANRRRR
ncbi:uncharacterized protein V1516DRAFT_575053 [Lipomyces oligophaga]|uniref:uncharacterized protein n=1 Tax=Lipomyces oligophaga TaxID=45792 RepID=UPI0034CD71EE